MTQGEFILTSDAEAFALGEKGRRLVLAMAVTAYTRMLHGQLVTLKEAFDEQSWTDYDKAAGDSYISGLRGTAYDLLRQACGIGDREHSYRSQALYRLNIQVTGASILSGFTYFQEIQWRRNLPKLIALYREAEDGTLQKTLEHAYAATDPTLAPEYAATLLPSR